jgi:heme/copper-type cytochrome/quinol oxidase subunit 2
MEAQTQAQVLTLKDWMITILITAIPLVGFIMLFVWAFGSNENPNKSNWAKASLIWVAIAMVLTFFLWGTIAALFFASGGAENFDDFN